MRYHWGLAVGHQFGHATAQTHANACATASDESYGDGESYHTGDQVESRASDHEDAGESGPSSDSESEGSEVHEDSLEVLAMEDMYGDSHEFKCYE
jgi:hypothetical protein